MTEPALNATYAKPFITLIVIAIIALPISAAAQNVYKCGNSYGQSPCAGGSVVAVDDARDLAQKKQSDEATLRDAKLARAIEKDRIAQERTSSARQAATVKAEKSTNPVLPDGVVHKITPKGIKTKVKKPEAFVAEIPGSETKPVRKKTVKKKPATPA